MININKLREKFPVVTFYDSEQKMKNGFAIKSINDNNFLILDTVGNKHKVNINNIKKQP